MRTRFTQKGGKTGSRVCSSPGCASVPDIAASFAGVGLRRSAILPQRPGPLLGYFRNTVFRSRGTFMLGCQGGTGSSLISCSLTPDCPEGAGPHLPRCRKHLPDQAWPPVPCTTCGTSGSAHG